MGWGLLVVRRGGGASGKISGSWLFLSLIFWFFLGRGGVSVVGLGCLAVLEGMGGGEEFSLGVLGEVEVWVDVGVEDVDEEEMSSKVRLFG